MSSQNGTATSEAPAETDDEVSKAELKNRLDELEKQLQIMEAQLDGTMNKQKEIIDVIAGGQANEIGAEYSVIDAKRDVGEPLAQKILDLEMLAETALSVARTESEGADANQTKKGAAKTIARNEVIRSAITDSSKATGSSVTTPDVATMAKPELKLAPKTIRDAFETLDENWSCMEFVEGDGRGRGDPNTLRVDASEITPDLARAVASDVDELDTEAVMNKVHNRDSSEGV